MDTENSERSTSTPELLDVSVIDKALRELTQAERYAIDSFMFLLRVKFREEGRAVPMTFQQTAKLVRDIIHVMDLEDI